MTANKLIAAAILLTITAFTIAAQQPANRLADNAAKPAPGPVSATPPQIADIKIAVINIAAFGEEKTGIAKLLNAYAALERELAPHNKELNDLQTRGQALSKEYETLSSSSAVDQSSVQKKLEEIQNLEKVIKRKQEDTEQLLKRRESDLTGPVWLDINKVLKSFAQARGISLILERGRLVTNQLIFIVDDKADITRDFINEYNRLNPVAATPAPAAKP